MKHRSIAGTVFVAALAAVLLTTLAACGHCVCDPVGPVVPCTGTCIVSVAVNPHHLALTPGDTVRLSGVAITASGLRIAVDWRTYIGPNTSAVPVRVDSTGLVTAVSAGEGGAYARAVTDTSKIVACQIRVVAPDSSVQPFIALYRDAATGDTLNNGVTFTGRDSIDVVVSYVVGRSTVTAAAPALLFQIRGPGTADIFSSVSVPLPVRGRGAFVTVRVNLGEKTATGARRFPPGQYDFFVLLPLADGRQLGDLTGYPVAL